MQIIIPWQTDAATYAVQQLHRTVRAPEQCPRCGKAGALEALGYYGRGVSAALGKLLEILVRRFFVGCAG